MAGFRKVLVAAQVRLSLLLPVAAGLFVRSLANLHSLDPGFAPPTRSGALLIPGCALTAVSAYDHAILTA